MKYLSKNFIIILKLFPFPIFHLEMDFNYYFLYEYKAQQDMWFSFFTIILVQFPYLKY